MHRKLKHSVVTVFGFFLFGFMGGCAQPGAPAGNSPPSVAPASAEVQAPAAPPPNAPNVVWILLDALRAKNLSAYGYARKTTPNLDDLAARGVLFENHSTQGFNTVDSVPSYMTGRYFATPCIGQLPWEWASRTPPPDEQLLPLTLAENGYQTWLVTAHLWMTPETRIWKAFQTPIFVAATEPGAVQAPMEDLNAEALRLIDARDTSRPFFLYLHALDTHFPHRPRPEYAAWLPEGITEVSPPYDEAEQAYLQGVYDGDLAYTDWQTGLLLEELGKRGLLQNTIVVVSSDHGEILGEDGQTADHLRIVCRRMMMTPLIMSGPGLPADKRTAELTENIDIVPTLIAMTGAKSSARYDGRDLRDLFSAEFSPPFRRYGLTWKRSFMGPRSFVIRSATWVYEGDSDSYWSNIPKLTDRDEFAIAVPDDALRREVATAIDELVDKYDEFEQRPADSPAVFYMPVPGEAMPRDAYVPFDERKPDDDRWDLMEGLVRTWPGEATPPITLEIPVPSGTYGVMMEINTGMLPDGGPHCVIAYRTENAPEWSVVASPRLQAQPGYAYVDIGEHTVADGSFTITLRQALPRVAAASVQKFKFVPRGALEEDAGLSAAQQDEVDEKLRALGYLE